MSTFTALSSFNAKLMMCKRRTPTILICVGTFDLQIVHILICCGDQNNNNNSNNNDNKKYELQPVTNAQSKFFRC